MAVKEKSNIVLALQKFAKYAAMMALADTLLFIMPYLNEAEGISKVPWMHLLDGAGLVFIRSIIAGWIGSYANLLVPPKGMKKPLPNDPQVG